jgi:hypothetical protein
MNDWLGNRLGTFDQSLWMQVSACGEVVAVSAFGVKGTSYVTLGGGAPLGTCGTLRLMELMHEAQPPLLVSLDLRHADVLIIFKLI